MLLIIGGVIVTVVAVLSFLRVLSPNGLLTGQLGSMSEQWIAEHRVNEHAS